MTDRAMIGLVCRPTAWLVLLTGVAPVARSAAAAAAPRAESDPFGIDRPLPAELFSLIDLNEDGAIDDDEAQQALAQLPRISRTKTPLGQLILSALDANGNRRLDDQEAQQGVLRAREHARGVAREVRAVFDRLDQDGDERISVGEFNGLVQRLGGLGLRIAPRLAQFFNAMDVDRDGLISPAESQRGAEYLAEQIEAEQRRKTLEAKLRSPYFAQARQLVAEFDRDRDQQISVHEAARHKDLKTAFPLVDTNLDGQLSVDECYAHIMSAAEARKAAEARQAAEARKKALAPNQPAKGRVDHRLGPNGNPP